MDLVVTAARVLTAGGVMREGFVGIEDGVVRAVGARGTGELPPGRHVDLGDAILAPAFFDVHVHGSGGFDAMDATPHALDGLGAFLARHGVGSYLPTTVSAPMDTTLRALNGLAKIICRDAAPKGKARPLGVHIEGPFLSHAKRGAHAAADLVEPSVQVFERMWQAAEGQIRLMTIAPELPGALEVIAHATALGVRVSLGHSDTRMVDTEMGMAAGAASFTHTYNAMRRFDHRDPGILAAALTSGLYAELICDGLHVDPDAVRLYWKAKGPERAILITDAMSATGMPDGRYRLGELEVRVKNGVCLIGENTLAGSTLTMDRAVRNFTGYTHEDPAVVARLAARNPAEMTGLEGRVGVLAEGREADLVVLSPEGELRGVFLHGAMI